MGSNPINLVVRFVLEMAALVAMGFWGWRLTSDGSRFVVAAAIPLAAAALWTLSAVPEDPSRSGSAFLSTRVRCA